MQILFACVLSLLGACAFGAELRVEGDNIYISGHLYNEEKELFEKQLDIFPKIKRVIFTHCMGGQLGAASFYGHVIKQRNLDTLISGESHSACAAAFLAGKNRFPVDDFGLHIVHLHSASDVDGNPGSSAARNMALSLLDTFTNGKLDGEVRRLIAASWKPTAGVYFVTANFKFTSLSRTYYCDGSEGRGFSKCRELPNADPYSLGIFLDTDSSNSK